MDERLIKKIYGLLQDQESEYIFSNRLLYVLTADPIFVQNIVMQHEDGKQFIERLHNSTDAGVVLFGAGNWGRHIRETFPEINWKYIVDNHVNGRNGKLQVVSAEKFRCIYAGELVVVSTRLYHSEIVKQLREYGIPEKRILNAGKLIDEMSQRQYFDLPQLPRQENELFIDGGSFDGKSALAFRKWCKAGACAKIWAFEPDKENIDKIERNFIHDRSSVKIFPYGMWNRNTTLSFQALGNGTSKIDGNGKKKIEVRKLDDLVQNETVTFIKLDIEGAEKEAIEGAAGVIERDKPKMAVSIYHRTEDLWQIPALILKYRRDYRFFLRHYSIAAQETVLYAI